MSRTIAPEDFVQEYRPTQAVGAHFREAVPDVDGIIYRSSITGEPCRAVFVRNEQCVEASVLDDPTLYLVLERKRSF